MPCAPQVGTVLRELQQKLGAGQEIENASPAGNLYAQKSHSPSKEAEQIPIVNPLGVMLRTTQTAGSGAAEWARAPRGRGGRTRLPWPEHLHTSDEAQARDLLPCLFQRPCLIPDIPCPRQLHFHLFNVSRYIPASTCPKPKAAISKWQWGHWEPPNNETHKQTQRLTGKLQPGRCMDLVSFGTSGVAHAWHSLAVAKSSLAGGSGGSAPASVPTCRGHSVCLMLTRSHPPRCLGRVTGRKAAPGLSALLGIATHDCVT